MADFDSLDVMANTQKSSSRTKNNKKKSDSIMANEQNNWTYIPRDVASEINKIETPGKKQLRNKTSYTRSVQHRQQPLARATPYHGGSMVSVATKKRQRKYDGNTIKSTTPIDAIQNQRRSFCDEKKTCNSNNYDRSSSSPSSLPRKYSSSDDDKYQTDIFEIYDTLENSSSSFHKINKFSTPNVDVDDRFSTPVVDVNGTDTDNGSQSSRTKPKFENAKIPRKPNAQKLTNSKGQSLYKKNSSSFRFNKVIAVPNKNKKKHRSQAPRLKNGGTPITPGASLGIPNNESSFNNDILSDEIESSSQEGRRNLSICHLDNDEYRTRGRINSYLGNKNNGDVLGIFGNKRALGTANNGIRTQLDKAEYSTGRTSNRKKSKPVPDVIDISSDEESVFEKTSSPPRSPSPTRTELQPRKGERNTLYPVRISFENQVFSNSCTVSFRTGTKIPFISLSYLEKGDRKVYKVFIEDNSLKKMMYFLEEEDDDDVSISSKDPINILVLNAEASEENKLLHFCEESILESTKEDTSSPHRKKLDFFTNNQCCIVVELRSSSEFREKLPEIMEKNYILRTLLNENTAKLTYSESLQYSKPIQDDMQIENTQKLKQEESFSERSQMVTRSSKKTGRNYNTPKNGSDVFLVFPFKIENDSELDNAVNGLKQLSVQDRDDEYLDNGYSSSEDAKLDADSSKTAKIQYAHYLTIHESDLGRLEQGEFLNDTIIDLWMAWMWRKESHMTSDVHFFSSHFFSTLLENGPSGVSRWTSKKNIDIFSKSFIFMPINESLHWSLCVVCNPGHINTAARYYDSNEFQKEKMEDDLMPCILFMDSLKAHRKAKVANHVYKWLNFNWEHVKGESLDYKPFNRTNMPVYDPQVPYQNNSWDCGVFVCRYAHALYQQRHESITFSHGKHRLEKIITNSPLFDFGMKDIRQFRDELAKLIERLSEIYFKYRKKTSSNNNT